MDTGGELRFLKAKKTRATVVPIPTTYKPKFYRSPVFTAVIISILITSSVSAYDNPEFLQWAKEVVSEAIFFFKPDYSQKTGNALISRGNALRVKRQYEEAEAAYRKAIEKFSIKEDYRGLGNAYTELGILRTRTRNYRSAETQFNKALTYFGWAGDSDGRGYAFIKLGQLNFFRKHYKTAKSNFLTAQQYYKNSGNPEGLGNVALWMGKTSIKRKNFLKAVEYFVKAESKFRAAENERGLVNVYNSLNRALKTLGPEGRKVAAKYRQLAKLIKLETQAKDLPLFSIQKNFKWLTDIFNQNRNVYESELNRKAKQEAERAGR